MVHSQTEHPLLLETALAQTAAFFRRYLTAFFSAAVFGLLAYGFAMTNKLINHDEAHSLFIKGTTVPSGRWGLGFLDTLFPNYSMPWIYGLLTVVFIAAGACILARVFRIENRLLQGLLGGTLVVFPSLIGLFGYMFTSCSFALSFLLAIVSVALVQSGQKWCLLPAAGCLVFSLSIYQSYISLAAGLLVVLLIREVLLGTDAGAVLKKGIFYVLFLVGCLLAYYLGTQAVFLLTGTEMGGYAAGNFAFTPAGILSGAVLAYRNFLRFFTEGFCGLMPTAFSRLVHTALLLLALGLVPGLLCAKKHSPGSLLLLALLLGVLPLAVNCMYMITTAEAVHTLVLYGFVSLYVLMTMIAQLALDTGCRSILRQLLLNALTVCLSLVILCNTYIANEAFLHLHLRYENAYAFYGALVADIRQRPEFTEEAVLAVVGDYQQPGYYSEHFEHIHSITGVYGFVPDNYSKERFLEYYLGLEIPFATQKEIDAIRETPEFAAMAVYPYYGSVKSFGNIMVVKLS